MLQVEDELKHPRPSWGSSACTGLSGTCHALEESPSYFSVILYFKTLISTACGFYSCPGWKSFGPSCTVWEALMHGVGAPGVQPLAFCIDEHSQPLAASEEGPV